MNQVRCPRCDSVNVTVVSTDPPRALVTIQCFNCGQTSDIHTEQFTVDTDDLPQE